MHVHVIPAQDGVREIPAAVCPLHGRQQAGVCPAPHTPHPSLPAAAARAPCKPLLPTPQKQEPVWKSKRVLTSQAGDHGESRMGGRMGGMRAVPKPRM
jgi:hypothetical protein